jgi:pantetheine-phosphate adenylyltransferase
MSTAIYPGSFNPWTKGHADILSRALKVFDEVLIVVAINPAKNIDPDFIKWTLNPLVSIYKNVQCISHDGLVSEFKLPIIRGVRSSDWEYEQNLASWNRELGVDTFFLSPTPSLSHINSSALRSLYAAGIDISDYVDSTLVLERWKKAKIPENKLFAGKISIGKSHYLSEQPFTVLDCDDRFWKYFDADGFTDTIGLDFKINICNAIREQNIENFNSLIKTAADFVNWEGIFHPDYSLEASALGVWWEYIPDNILANYQIVELTTSDTQRTKNIENRKLSMDWVHKMDAVYKSPGTVDEQGILLEEKDINDLLKFPFSNLS